MDIREKMRRDWDRRAKVDPRYWVAATEEADEASYEASALRDTQALIEGLSGISKSARVLDLGCGIGRLAGHMADHFAEVHGVDVSEEMIEEARRLHAGRPNLVFLKNSGSDLDAFADQTFDLVFSYSVLPHLPPDVVRAYFHGVNRVLKRGGVFRYQFWVGKEVAAAANDTLTIRVYDEATFLALNEDYGFEVSSRDEIDYLDPVLNLKPIWVNARSIGAPRAGPPSFDAQYAPDLSADEVELEYGLLLYLAVKHAERGEMDSAVAVLHQAISTDPTKPAAYVQLGSHLLERDDVAGARGIFADATKNAPETAACWVYLAYAEEALGDFRAAFAALRKLEHLDDVPTDVNDEAQRLRAELVMAKR